MKLEPLIYLDFEAVRDIRRACDGQAPEVFDNIAHGRSHVYRMSGTGLQATAVIQRRDDLLLIEALTGHDKRAQLTAKFKQMAQMMARALGCKGCYAVAKSKIHARLYARFADCQFHLGGKDIFYGVA